MDLDIPSLVSNLIALSPGGIVLWLLEKVGVNPGEMIMKPFSGDWEAFSKSAVAMRHLAEYLEAESASMTADLTTLQDGWRGVAADQPSSYFTSNNNQLLPAAQTLREAYAKTQDLALGVAQVTRGLADMVNYIFQTIMDALACFWWPPLAVKQGIAAARGIFKAIDMFTKFMDILDRAAGAIALLKGLFDDQIGKIALGVSTSYHHPLVAATRDPQS